MSILKMIVGPAILDMSVNSSISLEYTHFCLFLVNNEIHTVCVIYSSTTLPSLKIIMILMPQNTR